MTAADNYTEGFLDEKDGHRVKWYRYGSSGGQPVIFFHGGPGSGFNHDQVSLFDFTKVDLITFDQRGTGHSMPYGEMKNNSTQHLVEDCERLRESLDISKWSIAGHSWGATLGLVYAETFPQRVESVTLCSLFLGRKKENDWNFQGVRQFFPDKLDEIKKSVGAVEDGPEIIERALFILNGDDTEKKRHISWKIGNYFSSMSQLSPKESRLEDVTDADTEKAKILLSYTKESFFITENQICERAHQLFGIKTTIVHGRLDFDSPVEQAFAFKNSCSHAELTIVQGGHSLREEPLRSAYKNSLLNNLG